ncbi:MAG: glycoside hydrolase family 30 protein [Candidatus Hermodarchaeia archaeon]|jgi:O-glycosyl hydrolase
MRKMMVIAGIIWLGWLQVPCSGEKILLQLKPDEVRQEIDGFGASGAWWAQIIGGWEESKRKKIVGLLFGKEGIGLSIYRYNVGAGSGEEIGDPWRRAETFETAKGEYDWERDKNAMRILREACAIGVKNVILFANSPPRRMTKSGYTFSGKGADKSNLRDDMYGEFARYLADITEHFIRVEKIPVKGISPINEPQWDWDGHSQEGCHYSAEELVRMVEIMLKEIERRGLPVEVEVPENGSWERVLEPEGEDWRRSPVYLETLLDNKYVREHMDSYALHSYWANLERKKAFAKYFFAKYPEKKLQMTEWCEMKGGRDYGMDSALNLAREIIDDLVWGGVSSWQYWIAVSRYNFRDGLIYVNEREREIIPIKRLWAMGNFSRFIWPGYRRFEVEHNSTVLRAVGCKSLDGGRLVVVVMNPGKKSEEVELHLQKTGGVNFFDACETSKANDLKIVSRGVKNNKYNFPAESVTTLVIK